MALNRDQVYEAIGGGGFFSVKFLDKSGEVNHFLGRLRAVNKLTGVGAKYDAKEYNVIRFFALRCFHDSETDAKLKANREEGTENKNWRCFKPENVIEIKAQGEKIETDADPSLVEYVN